MEPNDRLLMQLGVSSAEFNKKIIRQYEDFILNEACDKIKRFYRDNEGLFGASIDTICRIIMT